MNQLLEALHRLEVEHLPRELVVLEKDKWGPTARSVKYEFGFLMIHPKDESSILRGLSGQQGNWFFNTFERWRNEKKFKNLKIIVSQDVEEGKFFIV